MRAALALAGSAGILNGWRGHRSAAGHGHVQVGPASAAGRRRPVPRSGFSRGAGHCPLRCPVGRQSLVRRVPCSSARTVGGWTCCCAAGPAMAGWCPAAGEPSCGGPACTRSHPSTPTGAAVTCACTGIAPTAASRTAEAPRTAASDPPGCGVRYPTPDSNMRTIAAGAKARHCTSARPRWGRMARRDIWLTRDGRRW